MSAPPPQRTDWSAWHRSYEDPASSLARRLTVVRRRIGEVLDAAGDGQLRILSLCAGAGRDLLPELAARPDCRASVTLVELDGDLAATARQSASTVPGVDVRQGDAGAVATFADVLPVDLLLLCGIFGNISTEHVRRTVDAAASMVADGGTVIWTRGNHGDGDLRPVIRRWFVGAGFEEVGFDGEPEAFGVGVARAPTPQPSRQALPSRLFEFVR